MDPRELQRIMRQLPDNLAGVFISGEEGQVPAKPENFKLCWWKKDESDGIVLFFTEEEKTTWDADRDGENQNPPLIKLDHPVLLIEIDE